MYKEAKEYLQTSSSKSTSDSDDFNLEFDAKVSESKETDALLTDKVKKTNWWRGTIWIVKLVDVVPLVLDQIQWWRVTKDLPI